MTMTKLADNMLDLISGNAEDFYKTLREIEKAQKNRNKNIAFLSRLFCKSYNKMHQSRDKNEIGNCARNLRYIAETAYDYANAA